LLKLIKEISRIIAGLSTTSEDGDTGLRSPARSQREGRVTLRDQTKILLPSASKPDKSRCAATKPLGLTFPTEVLHKLRCSGEIVNLVLRLQLKRRLMLLDPHEQVVIFSVTLWETLPPSPSALQ
jgi:hypothetical protein